MKNSATATMVRVRHPPMLWMLNLDGEEPVLLLAARRLLPFLDDCCCFTGDVWCGGYCGGM